jgi:hypothetical protein
MATEQEHFDAARRFQEYYDGKLRDIGMRAPTPVLGQNVTDYRRETDRQIKRAFLPPIHPLYKVQYRALDNAALDAFEPQLLKAAADEAYNPATVDPGQLRQINKRDEYGVLKEVQFIGPESFVKQMGRPGRRAVIRTPDTHPGWFPKEIPSVWLFGHVRAA